MSDLFYRAVRTIGRPAFWSSSRPIAAGVEHVPRAGPCLIAATHQSPYDVPVLIRHTPRLLDFVSIREAFETPLVAWFYGSMNAFPLDRSGPDASAVRTILGRLRRSRAVAMFPEGGVRSGGASVVHTGRLKAGCGRLAALAGAPVVPCVIRGADAYRAPTSWLPLGRVRYGIIYGPPIDPRLDAAEIEERLRDALVQLHGRLGEQMGRAGG